MSDGIEQATWAPASEVMLKLKLLDVEPASVDVEPSINAEPVSRQTLPSRMKMSAEYRRDACAEKIAEVLPLVSLHAPAEG